MVKVTTVALILGALAVAHAADLAHTSPGNAKERGVKASGRQLSSQYETLVDHADGSKKEQILSIGKDAVTLANWVIPFSDLAVSLLSEGVFTLSDGKASADLKHIAAADMVSLMQDHCDGSTHVTEKAASGFVEDRSIKVHSLHPDTPMFATAFNEEDVHVGLHEEPDLIHVDASQFHNANTEKLADHLHSSVPVLVENHHDGVAEALGLPTFGLSHGDHFLLQVDPESAEGENTARLFASPLVDDETSMRAQLVALLQEQTELKAQKKAATAPPDPVVSRPPRLHVFQATLTFPVAFRQFRDIENEAGYYGVTPKEQHVSTNVHFDISVTPIGEIVIKSVGEVTAGDAGPNRKSKSGMYFDNPPPVGYVRRKDKDPYLGVGYYNEEASVQYSLSDDNMIIAENVPSNKATKWTTTVSNSETWSAHFTTGGGFGAAPHPGDDNVGIREHDEEHGGGKGEMGAKASVGYGKHNGLGVSVVVPALRLDFSTGIRSTSFRYALDQLEEYDSPTSSASTPVRYNNWHDVVKPQNTLGFVQAWKRPHTIPHIAANKFTPYAVTKFEPQPKIAKNIGKVRHCENVAMEVKHTARAIMNMYGIPFSTYGYFLSKSYENQLTMTLRVCFGKQSPDSDGNAEANQTFRTSAPVSRDTSNKYYKREKTGLEHRKLISSRENFAWMWEQDQVGKRQSFREEVDIGAQ